MKITTIKNLLTLHGIDKAKDETPVDIILKSGYKINNVKIFVADEHTILFSKKDESIYVNINDISAVFISRKQKNINTTTTTQQQETQESQQKNK